METLTLNGSQFRVIRRQATAEVFPGTYWAHHLQAIGARGYVFLLKARGGTHVFKAVEYADGTIGQPFDTHKTVEGYGVR